MHGYKISDDGREQILTYEEKFGQGVRRAFIGYDCNESVSVFMVPLYLLGWKSKVVLYAQTLQGWNYNDTLMPFSDEDREHVLRAFVTDRCLGHRVKVDTKRFAKDENQG